MGEIDLVQALGLARIGCAVAAIDGDPAAFSRHTVSRLDWFDPWDRSQAMLDSLVAWGRRQSHKPVLFFNGDHDLLMVSRNRELLREWFSFVVAEERLVEDLVDKERFAALARELNLPVPASVTLDPAREGPEGHDLRFPLVVKPLRHRHETWNPMSGGSKALHVADASGLERLWGRLKRQGQVVLQSLIPGPESRIESYHVYLGLDGEVRGEFTGRKIRTLPPEFGDTTALEITNEDDVISLGRDVGSRLGLTGVAKFDFKRDPGGRLWLLEINPRFNLWHHAGAVAGTNIPHLVYADMTGTEPPSTSIRSGVRWVHPTRDLRSARAEGIPVHRWIGFAARCETRWGLSLRDPMPFVRGVLARRVAKKLKARR